MNSQETSDVDFSTDIQWKNFANDRITSNESDANEKVETIQIAELHWKSPRLIQGVAAKIDLQGSLEFVVTPSNGDDDLEADGLKVSTFLTKYDLDLAINGGPFSPVSGFEGEHHDISGLQISDGSIVSPYDTNRPALLINDNNEVLIFKAIPDDISKEFSGIKHAVSGFKIVLENGKPTGNNKQLHPRTAAGVSEDGRWLFLLVIDGRQPSHSDGITALEVGMILKTLGAHVGINLDGGGTTAMVGRSIKGKSKLLNRPINAGVRGIQRPTPSHLGIRVVRDEKN